MKRDNRRYVVAANDGKGIVTTYREIKVKQSRYRPGVAQRVPGSSQI